MGKRGQISVEYMIVVGFIVFVVVGIVGTALVYASSVRDKIKSNQVSTFAEKITGSAESVYYSGTPSQATIHAYLPEGVRSLGIVQDPSSGEYFLAISYISSSGEQNLTFSSAVPIVALTDFSFNSGLKRFVIKAEDNYATISES